MKKILFLLLLSWRFLSPAQQGYWQQAVNYSIDVSLNDVDHTLEGFEKVLYINNSPDTLAEIWFHLWPNAFKNDQTAFSEQLLQQGRTDFYFSSRNQKGYINRLDFRINGVPVKTEDHPLYVDLVKVILAQPLAPGEQVEITTPFHEKIPDNFSRGGHTGQSYQITQWYPKAATYDRYGWHLLPYLNLGEYYNDFGKYEVRITLPANYAVAATGNLQNEEEKNWLATRKNYNWQPYLQAAPSASTPAPEKILPKKAGNKKGNHEPVKKSNNPSPGFHKKQASIFVEFPPSEKQTKTLLYHQDSVTDFAWFADKRFIVQTDTVILASGKPVNVSAFYLPQQKNTWAKSIPMMKRAVRFHSDLIGEYPYNTVAAVEAKMGFDGGMEYPTITSISPMTDERALDLTLSHEIGHNWFQEVLASNERRYPWMDEGINTYYDNRYEAMYYPPQADVRRKNFGLILDPGNVFLDILEKEKRDQPISTASEDFTALNYSLVGYTKTGLWMKQLEDSIGQPLFDLCMKIYFGRWQFRHPYPEDFKLLIETASYKSLGENFAKLDATGPLTASHPGKKIKPSFLFSLSNSDSVTHISFAPAFGFNKSDDLMAGVIIHNFNLPPTDFQFLLAPLYATNSKQLNGTAKLQYTWRPSGQVSKIQLGLTASRFSTLSGFDSSENKIFGGFYKVVPSLRLYLKNADLKSTLEKWVEWKTFFIGEKSFDKYVFSHTDSMYFPTVSDYHTRYINQLTLHVEDYRVLYPYRASLELQQANTFYRINFTGNYFFNYGVDGGMDVRLFAAKFGYLGSSVSPLELYYYQPKLTATRGNEDYTYSNYFLGRNENSGFASQQIMIRDGGLKIRTDLFQNLQGRSDNWVAAINLVSSLPPKIIPPQIPLKLFLDVGTYADAWQANPPTSKFLYVGGLQLSLLKNIVNIYVPLVYSGDFSSQLKTVPEENTFWKKVSFSIDLQNVNLRRLFPNLVF